MPAIHQMKTTTLEFCGIWPVKTHMFGPVITATPDQRDKWLKQAHPLATSI